MGKYNGRKTIFDNRYTYLYMLIYLICIVLICALFNLQIINGDEYRQKSEKRLLREKIVEAPRGEIYDTNGNVLVTNEMGFTLYLYKTKIDDNTLNTSLLRIINILEKNSENYEDSLPIYIDENNNYQFNFDDNNKLEQEQKWKKKYKYDVDLTANQVIEKLVSKYKIEQKDINEIRKIAGIRFDISNSAYTAYKPYKILSNVSRQSINEIEEQNAYLPGINVSTVPIRSYVRGNLAAHILGYIGKIGDKELEKYKDKGYTQNDDIGKTGIEAVFEDYLRGKNGIKKVEMDLNGRVNEEYQTTESVQGNSIMLTLDANLQEVAEKALKENIEKISTGGFGHKYEDADAGACVVIDVNTGNILAMASYPTYDPSLFIGGIAKDNWNELNNNTAKPMFNRAIQAAYAPGSTFKMVTALAALESGVVTTTEQIYDAGIYDKGHNPRCWYYSSYGTTHGLVNVSDAIKTSCNYFFYEVGYRMGIDTLEKYARYLGLGQKTGIELIGEIEGTLASRSYANEKGNTWYVADTLSAAIGQSYNSFTPIQLAKYIATLVNGGKTINPTLIKDIIDVEGNSVDSEELKKYLNEKIGVSTVKTENMNINQENIDAILMGMKEVTDEAGGTAYGIFKNLPEKVGGKTGTAQAGVGSNNGVFVGFAPFDKPEIAVVVVVEHGGHGSYTAEVVRDIMAEYFGVNDESIKEDKTVNTIEAGIR